MKGWILAVAALGHAACSGADADVAGNYTIALTNGENGCNFANWTVGSTASGISMVATQDGSKLTVTIEGIARIYLEGLLGGGGNVFSGTVDGDDMSVESIGTRSNTSGNCTYTYNSKISGTLDGDVLRGRIEYRAADNGNSDCTTVHGCLTFQEYNGTRPPQ
ncbi:MAG: hypothetical protein H0T46_00355 [Deltaproteobacteria bacterium]|nr:hypothetical protein [Deltaproteobacteria bacterium]